MKGWFIFICFWLALTPFAYGQEGFANFKPPQSTKGEAFNKAAKRGWQHTDAQYLHPKQSIDKKSPSWFAKKKDSDPALSRKTVERTAGFFLFLLAVFLLVVLINYGTGGAIFSRFKKKDRFAPADENAKGDIILDASTKSQLSLRELENITDPREGLHALLVQALVRAAKQNNVGLRRSLTARDVLTMIPKTWRHHALLQALISRSELVFFGGRPISREDYAIALSLAQPMFKGGRGFE